MVHFGSLKLVLLININEMSFIFNNCITNFSSGGLISVIKLLLDHEVSVVYLKEKIYFHQENIYRFHQILSIYYYLSLLDNGIT